eukprot:scaffold75963_cov31-Prasinocladus_malaysianus.AAC.1
MDKWQQMHTSAQSALPKGKLDWHRHPEKHTVGLLKSAHYTPQTTNELPMSIVSKTSTFVRCHSSGL